MEACAPVALDVEYEVGAVGDGGTERVAPAVAQEAEVARGVHDERGGGRGGEILQRPAAGFAAVDADYGGRGEGVEEAFDGVVGVEVAV